jgi:hypothetical protein
MIPNSQTQTQNVPIDICQNAPLVQLGPYGGGHKAKRRYTKAQKIEDLAIVKYKSTRKGITYQDLIRNHLSHSQKHAQNALKRSLQKRIIFTIEQHKPQQYYATCIKSEIVKHKMIGNAPLGVTGSNLGISNYNSLDGTPICRNTAFRDELLSIQTLEGYVLPMLSSTPLCIHKMQLKLKVLPEYYHEISNPSDAWNKGKRLEEIIGNSIVTYHFYTNGIVMISVGNSNKPFKIEDDVDRGRLMAFFGQVKDRLALFLMDKRERVVPDVMLWELTQFDINRDVKVSDWMQVTGIKMQIRHLDHLFRIYIKSMQKDTVCRVEESISNNKPNNSILDTITKIFNPTECLEKLCSEISKKQDLLISKVDGSTENKQNNSTDDVMIAGKTSNGDTTK